MRSYISEMVFLKEFGENLKSVLEEYGMSQGELAKELGISRSSVNMYISGKRMPSIKTLVNIAHVLDCELTDLTDADYFVN